jgi:large-conductance mechanosensitive channel
MKKIMERRTRGEAAVDDTPADVVLLGEIRDLLRTRA